MKLKMHRSINRTNLAAVVLVLIAALTQCGPDRTVPAGLMGKWQTDAAKYGGCFFEIGDRSVKIGTREGRVDIGTIQSVRARTDGGLLLYEIRYTNAGQSGNLLQFYYDDDDQAIRLRNQLDIVWTKKKEPNGDVQ